MPTYVCTTAAGRLTPAQRAEIPKAITTIHAEEGVAPRYFVQVLFSEVRPDSHFIGGKPAPEGLIWIRADIRSGRTNEQKKAIMERRRLGVHLRHPGDGRAGVWSRPAGARTGGCLVREHAGSFAKSAESTELS